ncbi:hypothetical protein T439DRAFT_347773 [Meredithblackwellia eburnea MCA 4105]
MSSILSKFRRSSRTPQDSEKAQLYEQDQTRLTKSPPFIQRFNNPAPGGASTPTSEEERQRRRYVGSFAPNPVFLKGLRFFLYLLTSLSALTTAGLGIGVINYWVTHKPSIVPSWGSLIACVVFGLGTPFVLFGLFFVTPRLFRHGGVGAILNQTRMELLMLFGMSVFWISGALAIACDLRGREYCLWDGYYHYPKPSDFNDVCSLTNYTVALAYTTFGLCALQMSIFFLVVFYILLYLDQEALTEPTNDVGGRAYRARLAALHQYRLSQSSQRGVSTAGPSSGPGPMAGGTPIPSAVAASRTLPSVLPGGGGFRMEASESGLGGSGGGPMMLGGRWGEEERSVGRSRSRSGSAGAGARGRDAREEVEEGDEEGGRYYGYEQETIGNLRCGPCDDRGGHGSSALQPWLSTAFLLLRLLTLHPTQSSNAFGMSSYYNSIKTTGPHTAKTVEQERKDAQAETGDDCQDALLDKVCDQHRDPYVDELWTSTYVPRLEKLENDRKKGGMSDSEYREKVRALVEEWDRMGEKWTESRADELRPLAERLASQWSAAENAGQMGSRGQNRGGPPHQHQAHGHVGPSRPQAPALQLVIVWDKGSITANFSSLKTATEVPSTTAAFKLGASDSTESQLSSCSEYQYTLKQIAISCKQYPTPTLNAQ